MNSLWTNNSISPQKRPCSSLRGPIHSLITRLLFIHLWNCLGFYFKESFVYMENGGCLRIYSLYFLSSFEIRRNDYHGDVLAPGLASISRNNMNTLISNSMWSIYYDCYISILDKLRMQRILTVKQRKYWLEKRIYFIPPISYMRYGKYLQRQIPIAR